MHKIVISNINPSADNEKKLIEIYEAFVNSLPEKFKKLSSQDIRLLKREDQVKYFALRRNFFDEQFPNTFSPYEIVQSMKNLAQKMKTDINSWTNNYKKKLERPASIEQLKFIKNELSQIKTRYWAAKFYVDGNLDFVRDLEHHYQYLSQEILRVTDELKEKKSPKPRKELRPDNSWELLVPKNLINWFEEVREEYGSSLLRTAVAKAAFVLRAIEKKYILPGKEYKNDEKKLVKTFCRSYFFGANVTSALQDDRPQPGKLWKKGNNAKNLENQKIIVERIFKNKPFLGHGFFPF